MAGGPHGPPCPSVTAFIWGLSWFHGIRLQGHLGFFVISQKRGSVVGVECGSVGTPVLAQQRVSQVGEPGGGGQFAELQTPTAGTSDLCSGVSLQ